MTRMSYQDVERTFDAFALGLTGGHERSTKWRRILKAATRLFSEQGFRKTSVAEIAHQAQVAKGTVYLYFETKVGLLFHALVEEKKAYMGCLRPVLDGALEPAERLRMYIRLMVTLSKEMPLVSRVLSGDRDVLTALEEEIDPDLREQMFEFWTAFLSGLIDGAAAPHHWSDEELRDRAAVILGLLHSSGFFADDAKRAGLSHDRMASLMADTIVDGIRHSPGHGVAATVGRELEGEE